MNFKLVISDPKSKKAYQKEVEQGASGLIGKKIGETSSGNNIGLPGYKLEITGGTDVDGFPMRRDVEGTGRKRLLLSHPPGFHPVMKGQRKRKSVRGNVITNQIIQVNAKIVEHGAKAVEELLGAKKEAEKTAEKREEGVKAEKKVEEKKAEKEVKEIAEAPKEGKTEKKPVEEKKPKEEEPAEKTEEVKKEPKKEGAKKPKEEKKEEPKPAQKKPEETKPEEEGSEVPEEKAEKEKKPKEEK
jgi:small subunit ribosomal protein S6e